tara:strand:- start:153 stop:1034 length:882 start_codon:yes stop_codon:yes gene_type:complete
MAKTEIPFMTGFDVKPTSISAIGIVTFTDGAEDVTPNQLECEAYGYTYDRNTGTCSTFIYNTNIDANIGNISNTIKGAQNTAETGTNNNLILGESNTIRSTSRNNLIVGSLNEISNGINNSTVLGFNGKATTQAEVVIGGGIGSISDSTDAATFISKRKTSVIELAGVTIDNTATNLTVSGGDSFINVEANSIIGFDIYITRLELGGSAGTAGNYSYRNIRGAVKIDNSRTMTFVVGFSRNIAKSGVNGTCVMAETTVGTDLSISVNVQDRNNVHNLWTASVTLHEVVSTTTF